MFCQNCGIEVIPGSAFCQNCGAKAEADAGNTQTPANTVRQPAFQQAPTPPPPVYTQPPVNSQPQVYTAPPPIKKQKKHHTGLWIFLSILVLSTAAVLVLLGKSIWAGPKDLGIRYTQKDFNNVIQQLGMQITGDLGGGNSYDNKDILAGNDEATGYFSSKDKDTVRLKPINYKDYNYEFSNPKKVNITFTDVEATAFINEIGLSNQFLWMQNPQIKIEDDGSVKMSTSLNIRSMIDDLFEDFADKIPIKLPDTLNIYLEGPGKFSIRNNTINNTPQKISSSLFTVPKEYLTDDNANSFASYFTKVFNKIGFIIQIDSFYIQDGAFHFEGTVPTVVRITPKNTD